MGDKPGTSGAFHLGQRHRPGSQASIARMGHQHRRIELLKQLIEVLALIGGGCGCIHDEINSHAPPQMAVLPACQSEVQPRRMPLLPSMPPLFAIVAMSPNRVIGKEGKLPWHHPEDLRFFKRTTLGQPVLMGRSTFESIGRPLPGRRNIVLSRTMTTREDVEVIRDPTELGRACGQAEKVFVIGGAEVFRLLLPFCRGLYLTVILKEHEGDTLMPPFEHLFTLDKVLERTDDLEFRYYQRAA